MGAAEVAAAGGDGAGKVVFDDDNDGQTRRTHVSPIPYVDSGNEESLSRRVQGRVTRPFRVRWEGPLLDWQSFAHVTRELSVSLIDDDAKSTLDMRYYDTSPRGNV